MRLRRLIAEGFRNLEPTDLSVETSFVVLHGPNAQGKTNALEAIHLLATLKPLHGRRVGQLVAWGEPAGAVSAFVEHEGIERHYRVDLTSTGRTVRLDGKRVHQLGDDFAGIRAIAFTPADGRIVSGEPSRRRDWLDRAVFTAAPAHLERARAYRQCLKQKASLLRAESVDLTLLDVLDAQLSTLGAELAHHRARMLADLRPHVQHLHAAIAGGHGALELRYATRAEGETTAARAAALRERLAEVRPREVHRRTTLAGPQLDDVRITIDGRASRDFASRGQVRSVVLALKLAEMVAARERGEVPLFLIDDASTELDGNRTRRLVDLLTGLGAQVFATTTDARPLLGALPADDTLLVEVHGGSLTPPPSR